MLDVKFYSFDDSGLACGEIYEPQSAAWYQSSFQPLTITESNKPRNTIELLLAQSYRSVDHQQQSLGEFPDQKVTTRSLPAQSYQQFGQPSHLGEFSESGMTAGSLYCGQPTSYYPHHHFDCTTSVTQVLTFLYNSSRIYFFYLGVIYIFVLKMQSS